VKLALAVPLLLLIMAPLAIISALVIITMVLYYGWYLCECLRDSATGGIRAPDTAGQTPGPMDLFSQNLLTIVCTLVFAGLFASLNTSLSLEGTGTRILAAAVAYFYPISLLGVVTLESLRGLNPLYNLRNIARTFLPYTALLIIFCLGQAGLFALCFRQFPSTRYRVIALALLEIYFALISAHALGRFAWRYQDKLDWE